MTAETLNRLLRQKTPVVIVLKYRENPVQALDERSVEAENLSWYVLMG